MQHVHIYIYVYLSYTEDDGNDACKYATDALAIYGAMDDCRDKSTFLNRFISEGRGKGKDALKFMYSYQRIATRAKRRQDLIHLLGHEQARAVVNGYVCTPMPYVILHGYMFCYFPHCEATNLHLQWALMERLR